VGFPSRRHVNVLRNRCDLRLILDEQPVRIPGIGGFAKPAGQRFSFRSIGPPPAPLVPLSECLTVCPSRPHTRHGGPRAGSSTRRDGSITVHDRYTVDDASVQTPTDSRPVARGCDLRGRTLSLRY